MVLHWVIKTKGIFLRDKLMINKLYTLHPRRKKFSSFLTISEDPLEGILFIFGSTFSLDFSNYIV